MTLRTRQWHLATDGRPIAPTELDRVAAQAGELDLQLLIVLGDKAHFNGTEGLQESAVARLQAAVLGHAPKAVVVGCSTAGEIVARRVHTGSLVIIGIRLQHAHVRAVSLPVALMDDSERVGHALSRTLRDCEPQERLQHLWVLAPGVQINGSALVQGLREGMDGLALPSISGGLAGDGGAFSRTYTLGPQGVTTDHVVAVGLWGAGVVAGSIARGGWSPFGPVRRITRARGNRLDEMDHEPALTIYRRYLGDYAKDLPASALLFPLEVTGGPDHGLIRTILGIDDVTGGLILAGDVEVDSHVRLMTASPHQLTVAAEHAAQELRSHVGASGQGLALLVSCVGRRIVMGDLIDEEVEAVCDGLPADTCISGFYSNGEIAAWNFHADCRLHNQTMTITWLSEADAGPERSDA